MQKYKLIGMNSKNAEVEINGFLNFKMKFVFFLILKQLKKCKIWGHKWQSEKCLYTHTFKGYLFKLTLLMWKCGCTHIFIAIYHLM